MFGRKKQKQEEETTKRKSRLVEAAYASYKEERARIMDQFHRITPDIVEDMWKREPRYKIDRSGTRVELYWGTISHEYVLDPMTFFRNEIGNSFAGGAEMEEGFHAALLETYVHYLQNFTVKCKPYYMKISEHNSYHAAVDAMKYHIADRNFTDDYPVGFDENGNPM